MSDAPPEDFRAEHAKRWPFLTRLTAVEETSATIRVRLEQIEKRQASLESRVIALESRKENHP